MQPVYGSRNLSRLSSNVQNMSLYSLPNHLRMYLEYPVDSPARSAWSATCCIREWYQTPLLKPKMFTSVGSASASTAMSSLHERKEGFIFQTRTSLHCATPVTSPLASWSLLPGILCFFSKVPAASTHWLDRQCHSSNRDSKSVSSLLHIRGTLEGNGNS